MDKDSVTVKLSKPVQAHGETITELVLREPTGADLRSFPIKSEFLMGDMLDLAAAVSGVPVSTMNSLSATDAFAVVGGMGNFMGGGTGSQQ